MKALIQRVKQASVKVEGERVGSIRQGLLVLLGVEATDDSNTAGKLLEKVLRYRVFSDDQGRMNRSVLDVGGEVLVVSQFTLVADTRKGLRPSFSTAAPPSHGEVLYEEFVRLARESDLGSQRVQTGRFGADMEVALVNDGPVTFALEL